MGWQWTPYLLLLLAAATVSFGLAAYALLRRRRGSTDVAALAFAVTAVGTGLWSVATALQVASTTRPEKLFWGVVNVAPAFVEVGFLVFALAFAGYDRWLRPGVIAVAASEPVVYRLVVKPTHEYHDLFLRSATVVDDGGVAELQATLGPWALLDAAWGHCLVLVGMAAIAARARSADRRYRRQAIAVLVGAAIPLASNVPVALEVLGVLEWPYDSDLAPAAFAVTGVVVAVAVFRYRLLDPVPVARDTLLERMGDGVVVLDRADEVVDCNEAAREVVPTEDPVGRRVATAFDVDHQAIEEALADENSEELLPDGAQQSDRSTDERPTDGTTTTEDVDETATTEDVDEAATTELEGDALARLLRSVTPGEEVGVTVDGEHRYLAIDVVDLSPVESHVGRLVTLRDVTDDRRREALNVLNRMLRHNVRNDLTVVYGHAEMLEDQLDDPMADSAQKIRTVAERLSRRSDKARSVQDVLVDDERARTYDLAALARDRIAATDWPDDVELEVDAGDPDGTGEGPTVRADKHFATVLDELLENAALHAGEDPSAVVRVESDDDHARLQVADDGPGIPEFEYEPLERSRESQLEHGSGLGLWIVDWIVRSSDGSLSFGSSESGGALVTVEVPRVEEDP